MEKTNHRVHSKLKALLADEGKWIPDQRDDTCEIVDEQLEEYASLGPSAAAFAPSMAYHIETCPKCRTRLTEIRGLIPDLDFLDDPNFQPTLISRLGRWFQRVEGQDRPVTQGMLRKGVQLGRWKIGPTPAMSLVEDDYEPIEMRTVLGKELGELRAEARPQKPSDDGEMRWTIELQFDKELHKQVSKLEIGLKLADESTYETKNLMVSDPKSTVRFSLPSKLIDGSKLSFRWEEDGVPDRDSADLPISVKEH